MLRELKIAPYEPTRAQIESEWTGVKPRVDARRENVSPEVDEKRPVFGKRKAR